MRNFLLFFSFMITGWQINAQYCTPAVLPTGCGVGDTIDDFIIPAAGFSHIDTGCSTDNYGDFSADPALQIDLAQQVVYDFEIDHGFASQQVKIWVDLNVDQVFDASEVVFTSPGNADPTIGSFSIPASAQLGLTRMRVMNIYFQEPSDPCNPAGTFGEVHDYTVNILPPPPCPNPTDVALVDVFFDSVEISWTAVSNASNGYIWEVYATGDNPEVDTELFSGTFPAGTTQGVAGGFLPETTYDIYLAADCGATDGLSGFAPPVTFTTTELCSLPSTFSISNLNSDSVQLNWSSIPNASSGYIWSVFNAGEDPTTAPEVATGIATSADNSVLVSGLTENTAYDAYITTDCGADGLSDLSAPITFVTPCLAVTAPYVEDFESSGWVSGSGGTNAGDAIDNCWGRDPDSGFFWGTRSGTTTSGATGPDGANSGLNYVFAETSSGAEGDEAFLTTPLLDLSALTTPSLSFFYHMYGADLVTASLEVEVDNGSGYVSEFTISGEQQTVNEDPYIEQFVDLTAYAGQTIQIRFKAVRGSGFNSDIAIDDVKVDELPTCFEPEDLSIVEVFFDSVEITWTEEPNASDGYIWEVYASGDDPDVATPISSGTFATGTSQGITDGLMPETTYDLYLASDCGASDGISEFTLPVTFTTTELCSVPTSFDISNLLPDSVTLNWSSIPNATDGYQWAIFLAGADPLNDTSEASGTALSTENSVVVTGLSDDTAYDSYITTNCGTDGLSDLSAPVSFNTPCDIFTAPFFDNLEGAGWVAGIGFGNTGSLIDQCWVRTPDSPSFFWGTRSGATGTGGTGPNVANSGSNYIFAESSNGVQGDEAILLTPLIDISTLTNPQLSFFYHMAGATMGTLSVDVDAGSGFDLDVFSISGTQQTGSDVPWTEVLVDLNAYVGQTIQIRFRAIRGTSFTSDIALDDIRVDDAPTCIVPQNIFLTNLLFDSVDISWDEVTNAVDGYNWELYLTGDDPENTSPLQSGNAAFGSPTVSIVNLDTNTSYDFYLTADCGAVDGESFTVGPVSFITPPVNDSLCNAIPVTVGVIPPGDQYSVIDATEQPGEPVPACFNGGINGSVWFSFVAPASGEVEVSTDIPGGSMSDTEMAVYDGLTDCNDFTTLGAELGCSQDDGIQLAFTSIINLTGLTSGNTYYIQVDRWGTATPGTFGLSVLDTNPPCPNPENVQFVSSTTNTADFTWDDVVAETDGYNWFVYAAGASLIDDTELFSGSVGADVNTVTVTGLSASTSYDFYVQANCGTTDGLSIFSDAVAFFTQCDVFTAPLSENFDSASWISGTGFANAGDAINNCWSRNPESPDYFWGTRTGTTGSGGTGPDTANSPDNYIFTESSNGDEGDEALFFSPLIDISSLTDPALFFWYHMAGATTGQLDVDVDAGAGFVNIFTLSGPQQANTSDPFIEQIIDLSQFSGQTIQVRFRATRGSSFTGDIAIDDFSIDEAPPCLKPVSVTAVDVFFDSIEVSWGPVGNATNGYIWEIYNAGDDPDAITPVSSGTFPAGTTSGIAAGLTPLTDYDIYIESDCGPVDGTSGFSLPATFTTTELCSLPSSFTVNNITPDSATLNWSTIPNAVGGFEWVIFLAGEDPLTANEVASGVAAPTDISVLVTGLQPETDYDAYITTNCGADGLSFLSDNVPFTTPLQPVIVTVDAPAINETYCYGNSEVKEWLFTSSDGVTPVEIIFNSGTIEDGFGSTDRCRIFDGFDVTAPVLFDTDVDGTDMAGAQIIASSGAAYMRLESDIFGSCQGGVDDEFPLDFDVFAGTPSTATANVQIIHNSADPSAEFVDIYVNGTLEFANVEFRTATPFIEMQAEFPVDIDIAPVGSTDVTESIFNLNTTLAENENYVVVATGVLDPTLFDSSVNADIAFDLEIFSAAQQTSTNPGETSLLVYHGATDAPQVDVVEIQVPAGTLVDDVAYKNYAGYVDVPTLDFLINVETANNTGLVTTYAASLDALATNDLALTVLASGFLNPGLNQNGSAFGLWVALPSGGNLLELTEIAPQTAAPDPAAAQADVISLFSDFYTDVPVDTYLTPWSVSQLNDIQVEGNNIKRYHALNFAGIETLANPIDATNMDFFHIDVWSPNATIFRVKLVNDVGGPAQVEGELAFPIAAQEWVNLVIPLSDFADADLVTDPNNLLTARDLLGQFIISGLPAGFVVSHIDNVYMSDDPFISTTVFDKANFSIYPNPAEDFLNIQTTQKVDNLKVFDVLGQKVMEESPKTSSPTMNVENLQSGTYIINVSIGEQSKSFKFIKR